MVVAGAMEGVGDHRQVGLVRSTGMAERSRVLRVAVLEGADTALARGITAWFPSASRYSAP